MKSGIYKITNLVNGKFYIGSSKDIDWRWDDHKQYLRGGYHINPKLQHSWNKHGENKFVFEIVEEVEPNETLLLEREQHYLDLLKPYERNVGYNICPTAAGGDTITHNPNRDAFIAKMKIINHGENNGMFGKTHSDESIKLQKEKSVGRYTLDWFVKKYGQKDGEIKFQERRLIMSNRPKSCFSHPSPIPTFKGHIHGPDFYGKVLKSRNYFKEHWDEFVKLVKSKKYSQRQLSEMLGISRPALRNRIKQIFLK